MLKFPTQYKWLAHGKRMAQLTRVLPRTRVVWQTATQKCAFNVSSTVADSCREMAAAHIPAARECSMLDLKSWLLANQGPEVCLVPSSMSRCLHHNVVCICDAERKHRWVVAESAVF